MVHVGYHVKGASGPLGECEVVCMFNERANVHREGGCYVGQVTFVVCGTFWV